MQTKTTIFLTRKKKTHYKKLLYIMDMVVNKKKKTGLFYLIFFSCAYNINVHLSRTNTRLFAHIDVTFQGNEIVFFFFK